MMPRTAAAPRLPTTRRGRALARAGVLLYGQNYLIPLAKLCDVSTKTLRRWLDGDDIPGRVWPMVCRACEDRVEALGNHYVSLARFM